MTGQVGQNSSWSPLTNLTTTVELSVRETIPIRKLTTPTTGKQVTLRSPPPRTILKITLSKKDIHDLNYLDGMMGGCNWLCPTGWNLGRGMGRIPIHWGGIPSSPNPGSVLSGDQCPGLWTPRLAETRPAALLSRFKFSPSSAVRETFPLIVITPHMANCDSEP